MKERHNGNDIIHDKECVSRNDKRESDVGRKDLLCLIRKCFYVLAISGYVVEKRRQIILTNLPLIYCQSKIHRNDILQSLMSSLFLRSIRPSLFVGTRSWINSAWAFWKRDLSENHQRRREILNMSNDNAKIAIDWEFPEDHISCNGNGNIDTSSCVLDRHVVLILHGINTDTSFGYIRSFMKSCTNNGWIAAGMNLRGYGNINITTPRLQNMAYTNDLRNVIHTISSRMSEDINLFLVGYSLGANIIVKYLGEEGTSSTLPKCIAGAISLGNPFKYVKLKFPWDILIGLGTRKELLRHYNSLKQMTSSHYQKTLNSKLFSKWRNKKANVDDDDFYHQLRNNVSYPFETRVGYDSEVQFAEEAGSYRYASNVSVPLLIVVASDDTIAIHNTMTSFPHFLSNPNIIIVKTKTGGHLGWHTSPKNNPFYIVNWADVTASKFISSLLNLKKHNWDKSFQKCNSLDNVSHEKQPAMISRL